MSDVIAVGRRGAVAACAIVFALTGCRLINGPERQLPLPDGVVPEQVIDADIPQESITPLDPDDLAEAGRRTLAERQKRRTEELAKDPEKRPRKYNILALSGGAVYGAHSAGVLCGWTQSGLTPEQGGRPEFDVVTGVSTGALIAPFAFLGPKYDDFLRREYTTTRTEDIYTRRRQLRSLLTQSFVDNTPFRERVYAGVTDGVVQELAAEHEKGRRLYIGTTNADTKRIVLWDVGAIATRRTPEARRLICEVLIASASIPAFFPPVKFNVTIDGRPYEEVHVDGSVSRSLFFRPPVAPSGQGYLPPEELAGSNLYVLVAGKINPTPAAVRVRTFSLALDASSTLLYSETRGALYRMYTYCLLTGMNLRVAAIPEDEVSPKSATEFDPVEMTKLFEAGFRSGRQGDVTPPPSADPKKGEKADDPKNGANAEDEGRTRGGTAWRDVPPGLKGGEKQGARTGLRLTVRPKEPPGAADRSTERLNKPGPTAPPIPGGG